MSLYGRLQAAYAALRVGEPARDAVRLASPPSAPVGPTGERTRARVAEANAAGQYRGRRRRIAPLPVDRVRWLRADIERAQHSANNGELRQAGQIAEWCKEDLVVGGLFSTRCSVPRLPRRWRGAPETRIWLEGEGESRGVFDRVFPPTELEELAIDHLDLGAGVSIWVHPPKNPLPKLVRLDNQFLHYLPGEDRFQYQGWSHVYDVNPGDGVWVVHQQGDVDPWRRGIWAGLAYDQVSEDGAGLSRDGYIWKFGNPLVLAKYPSGAAETQKGIFFRAAAAINWALGTIGVSPGYDIELLQPKGEGREVFKDAEDRVERRAMLRIAGQVVTQTGGPGFANAEIFAVIQSHLVARTGQDEAATLNTQAIPQFLHWARKAGLITSGDAELQWDTTPPQQRKVEAEAYSAAAKAFWDLKQAGFEPIPEEFRRQFSLPVAPMIQPGEPSGEPLPAMPQPPAFGAPASPSAKEAA